MRSTGLVLVLAGCVLCAHAGRAQDDVSRPVITLDLAEAEITSIQVDILQHTVSWAWVRGRRAPAEVRIKEAKEDLQLWRRKRRR